MKLKFKVQPYQTNAVESVVDCFDKQGNASKLVYGIDPSVNEKLLVQGSTLPGMDIELIRRMRSTGFAAESVGALPAPRPWRLARNR